jgi:hypothetical protein
MKKLLLPLICFSLFSQESQSLWDFHPIHAGGNAIAIGRANVDPKNSPREGNLLFNKESLFVYGLLPVSKTTFFFPRVEWNTFELDWNKNAKFDETRFNYIQFALTMLSVGLENWRWVVRGDWNIDTKHFSDVKKYSLVSALLWGTHEIHRKWHLHLGAFGYTGFDGQEVYPIVGVDFAPNKKWFFQAVFPITYSIEYAFKPDWRISLKGRPLKERFRVGENEPQPQSVFSYSSMGAELNLHYEKFLRVEAEAFIGYNFGGNFYIKDQEGHNALYTHVQGAPYLGATLNWGF